MTVSAADGGCNRRAARLPTLPDNSRRSLCAAPSKSSRHPCRRRYIHSRSGSPLALGCKARRGDRRHPRNAPLRNPMEGYHGKSSTSGPATWRGIAGQIRASGATNDAPEKRTGRAAGRAARGRRNKSHARMPPQIKSSTSGPATWRGIAGQIRASGATNDAPEKRTGRAAGRAARGRRNKSRARMPANQHRRLFATLSSRSPCED